VFRYRFAQQALEKTVPQSEQNIVHSKNVIILQLFRNDNDLGDGSINEMKKSYDYFLVTCKSYIHRQLLRW
jgi:hypothetical protein